MAANTAVIKKIARARMGIYAVGAITLTAGFFLGIEFLADPTKLSWLTRPNVLHAVAGLFIVFSISVLLGKLLSIWQKKKQFEERYNKGAIAGDTLKALVIFGAMIGGLAYAINLQNSNNVGLDKLISQILEIRKNIPVEELVVGLDRVSELQNELNPASFSKEVLDVKETLAKLSIFTNKFVRTGENGESVDKILEKLKNLRADLDRAELNNSVTKTMITIMIVIAAIIIAFAIGCAIKEFSNARDKNEDGLIDKTKMPNSFLTTIQRMFTPTNSCGLTQNTQG